MHEFVCVYMILPHISLFFWMPAGTHTIITVSITAHAIDFNLWMCYTYKSVSSMEIDAHGCICLCAFLSFSPSLSLSLSCAELIDRTYSSYICL